MNVLTLGTMNTRIFFETFFPLVENSLIIFTLVAVMVLVRPSMKMSRKRVHILFYVLLVPIIVFIMLSSWSPVPGLRFDASWTVISVYGYFFGTIPMAIAALTAIITRIFIGGTGVIAGVVSIVAVAAYTTIVRKYLKKQLEKIPPILRFWIFGLVAHIIVLPTLLLVPDINFFSLFEDIAIPLFVIYPILSALSGLVITVVMNNNQYNQIIIDQKRLLQAAVDSPKNMEIYVLDHDYKYLTFNAYHKYCMRKYNNIEISIGDSMLESIKNDDIYTKFQSEVQKALKGISFITVDRMGKGSNSKYYEYRFTPIRDEKEQVIGVGVFSQDVSKQKEYENYIIFLNNHDNLTNLYNRRYYNSQIIKLDNYDAMPLSIVMADINGLKIVNDAFGHAQGDELLKIASEILKDTFKDYGFVARIGGDEFVAVLKNTSYAEAERLIYVVEDRIKDFNISGIAISISFGLATKDNDILVDEIIKEAEDNMYKYKIFHQDSNKSEAIATILKTLHEKNKREESHSKRVSEYCVAIGQMMKLSKGEINLLKISGILHDIGKIAIDDTILNKPGKLSDHEWEEIKKHPEIGFRILSASPQYAEISMDILHHHERYDGTGYPQGLKSEDISSGSRIIALADAYDAMTSSRPYRPALTKDEAIAEIEKNLGKQFDPFIGELFIKYLRTKEKDKKTAK